MTGAAPVPVPPPMPAAMKHMCAPEGGGDLIDRFFRGSAANLRPRAGAEALRDLEAELDAAIGKRRIERLSIGIGDHEIDALDVRAHHVRDGVAARAADADDANPRTELVDLRPDEIDAHA